MWESDQDKYFFLSSAVFTTNPELTMGINHLSRTLLVAAVSSFCFASVEGALKSPPPEKSSKSTFTYDELWNLEKGFWDSFLYPANLKQTQGNKSTVFASDVKNAG